MAGVKINIHKNPHLRHCSSAGRQQFHEPLHLCIRIGTRRLTERQLQRLLDGYGHHVAASIGRDRMFAITPLVDAGLTDCASHVFGQLAYCTGKGMPWDTGSDPHP